MVVMDIVECRGCERLVFPGEAVVKGLCEDCAELYGLVPVHV